MLVYTRWGRHHSIAALHVAPQYRRQGLGSQLLRMAEDWLYRCPIHFGGQSTPCYGGVEGPRPPFYGSTQRMGISVTETELLRFLSNRRYTIVEPGDISLTANLTKNPARQADVKALTNGLRLERVDHSLPFPYTEPANRREYESWLQLTDSPYAGVLLINSRNELCGHLCWYPMRSADRAGIYAFWLEPALRGQGLGALLLDTALADMACETQLGGPFSYVEVQSHSVRHAVAVQLYESRGFQIDDAWVNLVKT